MVLNFKAKDIAELEDKFNDSILGMLGNPKLSNLVIFIEKGLQLGKDDSYSKIDEYLAEGKSLEDLYLLIVESLQRNGFLDKTINFREMMEAKPDVKTKK